MLRMEPQGFCNARDVLSFPWLKGTGSQRMSLSPVTRLCGHTCGLLGTDALRVRPFVYYLNIYYLNKSPLPLALLTIAGDSVI